MSQNKPGPKELALRAARESRATKVSRPKPQPAVKEDSMPKVKVKASKAPTDPDSKKAIIAGLLKRKKGCTSNDVKEATGWPSVSMPAMAKACGLTLRKEKTEAGIRYYGS